MATECEPRYVFHCDLCGDRQEVNDDAHDNERPTLVTSDALDPEDTFVLPKNEDFREGRHQSWLLCDGCHAAVVFFIESRRRRSLAPMEANVAKKSEVRYSYLEICEIDAFSPLVEYSIAANVVIVRSIAANVVIVRVPTLETITSEPFNAWLAETLRPSIVTKGTTIAFALHPRTGSPCVQKGDDF